VQGDIKLAVITAHSPHYPANIAELQRATSFLFLRKKFFLGKPLFFFG
jgi:flavorubredoxin